MYPIITSVEPISNDEPCSSAIITEAQRNLTKLVPSSADLDVKGKVIVPPYKFF